MTIKKIAKGKLVKLDVAKCFTISQGGNLQFPLTNYAIDQAGIVNSSRPTTPEERKQWRENKRLEIIAAKRIGEDTFGITFDSAGESRLPPQASYVALYRDKIYQVLKARCRVQLGWGNPTSGLTKILCTETGEETYVKRHLLEVVY